MRLSFEVTERFQRDLSRFAAIDRARITKRVQFLGDLFAGDRQGFYKYVTRPITIRLSGDLESSLWVARVSNDIRLLFTAEEDPVFDELVVTLLRVVRHGELLPAFKQLANSLYTDPAFRIESLSGDDVEPR